MKLKSVFIVYLLSVAASTMYAGKNDGHYEIDGCASYQAGITPVVMTPSIEARVAALELAVALLKNKMNAGVTTVNSRNGDSCPSCSSCCCCVSTGNDRNDSCFACCMQ